MRETCPHPDCLLAALRVPSAFVRVQGRGTFKNSATLKRFGEEALTAGCHRLVMDMQCCEGLDSTFLGVLAGLAMRYNQKQEGQVVLIRLDEHAHSQIETLGIDLVVKSYPPGEEPAFIHDDPWFEELFQELHTPPTVSSRESAELVLQAHQNLIDISSDNAARFKDVITCLKNDVRQAGSKP